MESFKELNENPGTLLMVLGAVILIFSIVTSIDIFQVKAIVNIGKLGRVLVGCVGVIILIIGIGMHTNLPPAKSLNAKSYNTEGVALYDQGKYQEAETQFSKAVQLEPNNAEYRYRLGRTLHSQRKYQEA